MNITPNLINLEDFLDIFSPHYIKANKNIKQQNLDDFKKSILKYLEILEEKISENQGERIIANATLQTLLKSVGFQAEPKDHFGNSGIDMAIFDDNKQVAVIIETKKPTNKNEMINKEDINKKAFAEGILYYLRERESRNSSINFIIITDFYQFFIFDAKDFEIFNQKNNPIKKLYNNWRKEKSLLESNTQSFYDETRKIIATPDFLNSIPQTNLFEFGKINAAYFDLSKEKNERELFYLYKFFHPDFLLGKFNPNDSNTLNKNFYNELLYILGLCEKKQNEKMLILPSAESQNEEGTLYYNILSNLDRENKLDLSKIFEPALEILIIWLNRILFLKLLETSLSNYAPPPSHQKL